MSRSFGSSPENHCSSSVGGILAGARLEGSRSGSRTRCPVRIRSHIVPPTNDSVLRTTQLGGRSFKNVETFAVEQSKFREIHMPSIIVPKVPNCVKKTTLGSVFREKHVSELRFHKRRQERDEIVPKEHTAVALQITTHLVGLFLFRLYSECTHSGFCLFSNPRNSLSVKLTSETCFSRKLTLGQFGTFGTNIGGM